MQLQSTNIKVLVTNNCFSAVGTDFHLGKLTSQAVWTHQWQQIQGLSDGLQLMGQLLLSRHYLSLQRKSHEPKETLLYTKLSRINRQAILHLSWSTASWAVVPAEKRLGQELIRKSDGEEARGIFNVLKPPERLPKASPASAQPCELQGRQHQHKQKLSLSHQRHGTVLFQLWSPSNLTNASALRDWTVIKQAKCDDSALALAITLRHFSVETAWDGAGPRQADSRCSQHSVFMLFCGGKACRCFCVLC